MANLKGQKDFQDLYQEVALEVLDTQTASSSTDPSLTYIKQRVNDAYRELVTEFPFWFKYSKFTATAPTGSTTLTLDDDVVRIESMFIPTLQLVLREMTRETFNSFQPGGLTITGPSVPIAWIAATKASNNALQVDLFPEPDQAYSLEIWAETRFSDLSDDADVPVIPPEWQDVMLNKAKMYCFMKINDPKAQDFRELYQERLERMWLAYEQHLSRIEGWRDQNFERAQHGYPGLYYPYIAGFDN